MKKQAFELITLQETFPAGDRAGNLAKAISIAEEIIDQPGGPALLLLPELFPSGYNPVTAATEYAEEQDGLSFQTLSRVASKQRVHIAYGYAEAGEGGDRYNSLMLLGPDGKQLAHYRKIHLTQGEKRTFQSGSEFVVAETELGKIGLMICWDLAFPEVARRLTLQGAELLLAPVAWDTPYANHYRSFASVRALENSVFLATSNHVGRISGVDYFGESSIYGPRGNLLARADERTSEGATAGAGGGTEASGGTEDSGTPGAETARAYIDLDEIRIAREGYYTMLADRRSDLYE